MVEVNEQIKKIPFSFAKRHGVLVSPSQDGSYQVLYREILPNHLVINELLNFLNQPVEFIAIDAEKFDHLLTQTYQHHSDQTLKMAEEIGEELDLKQLIQELPKTEDLLESEDDAPIIRLLNALLSQAIKQNASDIHIETFENYLMVRFRIDGVLQEILQPQRVLAPLVVSRIKVMAKLDIAEKRLPQDGRITLKIAGHAIDIRVSTLPTSHGERVVLRLLDKKANRLDLQHLGMGNDTFQKMYATIHKPHGIILVTGPTGSGKTTTLYAALSSLNNAQRNILTVEDPIEYYLPGIGQTQVNYKVEMTFARGLRAILRQDPDIVMVGEIRDTETAQIAVQASLTGHLVLSTLHTNTAIGAITRLRDMGIEPFLLSSSVIGILAQRLVRLLCQHCKKAAPASTKEKQILSLQQSSEPINIYHAQGCGSCNHTGYRGRTGIYELIVVDEVLRTMIHNNADEQAIENHIRIQSVSMRQDGLRRVIQGETTLEEVLRVTLD